MKLPVLTMMVVLTAVMAANGRPAMAQTGAGSTASSAESDAASKPLQAGLQILSDTRGADFSGYLRRVHGDVERNWDAIIPDEAKAPTMKKGIAGIRLTILSDGRIGSMKLETPSGDIALDKAAWYALTSEGMFPPLPKEFQGPQLELRVGFYYNEPVATPASQSLTAPQ